MQTNRNEFFIKRDFGFYDTGILGVLPDTLFNIYEILRRYVWRSYESGDPKWRRLYADGKLAATVPQSEISAALNCGREIVNRHISTAKNLGWLKVRQDPNARRAATYILGERVKDGKGRYHEVFYADAWMRDLWDRLEAAANVNSDGSEKVSKLPWDERREICRAWMAESAKNPAKLKLEPSLTPGEDETGEDVSDPDQTADPERELPELLVTLGLGPNYLDFHSGVTKISQGVSGKDHTSHPDVLKKDHTIIEKPSAKKNRELEQQYRPASERGVEHLSTPRKTRTQPFPSPESERSSESKELKTITSPRTTEKESSRFLDLLPENNSPESSASAPDFSSNSAYTSSDQSSAESRVAKLAEIAEGRIPAPLDRTGETYRAKVERERARQAQISASRASRLRNFDGTKPYEVRQVLKHLEAIWSAESKAKFGPSAGAWQIQDRKMMESLLKSYTVEMLEGGMKYLVGNWDGLSKRFFKGNGGLVPSLGVLSRCHATIIPESAKYAEVADLANEWNSWWVNHPDDSPPSDLQSRYDQNRDKLKALGLV